MTFVPFELERLLSTWENLVECNLSESGVHPLTVRELLDVPGTLESVLSTALCYPQANGTPELRERIAALYPGATLDNVLVTVGCAEANFITLQTMVSPGDEVAIMLPNYLQLWGLGQINGLRVSEFHLREDRGWAPDLDELNAAVSDDTKLITVCNPNNPTGYVLTDAEMGAVVAAAERRGAWLLADEVYSGAERLTDSQTPSFWGRYDKVLALNSLSKAYGLPGLRIGWIVAPADTIADIWARHDYTTISAAALSNRLATIALSPDVRLRLLQRGRDYIRRGFPVLDAWLEAHGDTFSLVPPRAAAIAFVRYHLDLGSSDLVQRLIQEKSVLVAPGDHFGVDHHLRIGYGLPRDYLEDGLGRIHDLIVELQASA